MTLIGSSTPLAALDYVVLDTETTGLDARSARIVQIGAVCIARGAIVADSRLDRLVDPGVPIPPGSTAVHGITDAMVKGAPRFPDALAELQALAGKAIVVGHTLTYDLTILCREAELAGIAAWQPRALDVRLLARAAAPSLASYDLDRLCSWLGIVNKARHTALGDAEATAEVFLALLPRLREKGVRTLAEAEAASRRAAEREAQGGAAVLSIEPAAVDAVPVLQVIDSFPYRHRMRHVMSAPPLVVEGTTTVAAALRQLIGMKVSSLFVTDDSGRLGIVTERDVLRAVDGDGAAALAKPVGQLMKSPLITVREDDFVYRAIGRIERHGIRHLGVVDGEGRLTGAVTTRNLLRHRATTAIVLGDEIDSAPDGGALAAAWAKLTPMARSLLAEDVDARLVAAVISTEVCSITARSAELAETRMQAEGHGPPPVPYCVLVLGSAGRSESLLAADQDNAVVYGRGAADGPEDRWFARHAIHMTGILDEAGVPLCKGGVMARNAAWRMSRERWHDTIDGWIRRQRPADLLNVDIFFDAVPVHGDTRLGESIVDRAWTRAHAAPDFVKQLSELARDYRPPFTLFGNIRTDQDGRVDVKKGGLMPIFTAARVLALRHGLRARSTPERLRRLVESGNGAASDIEAVVDAHLILLKAVVGQQLVDAERGVPLSPRVDLGRLDKVQRAQLKDALAQVATAVALVGEGRI